MLTKIEKNLHCRLIREVARSIGDDPSITIVVDQLAAAGYDYLVHDLSDWRVDLCFKFISDDDYEFEDVDQSNTEAILAIRAAHADLIGSYEAKRYNSEHDWGAHLESIRDLETNFNCLEDSIYHE